MDWARHRSSCRPRDRRWPRADQGRPARVEETGFASDRWDYVTALSPNAATHANLAHIAIAEGVEQRQQPVDDPTERTTLVRLPIDVAVTKALDGSLKQAGHVAALLVALNHLGRWPSGPAR